VRAPRGRRLAGRVVTRVTALKRLAQRIRPPQASAKRLPGRAPPEARGSGYSRSAVSL